eukprot:3662774-Rhodomonas_salina.2
MRASWCPPAPTQHSLTPPPPTFLPQEQPTPPAIPSWEMVFSVSMSRSTILDPAHDFHSHPPRRLVRLACRDASCLYSESVPGIPTDWLIATSRCLLEKYLNGKEGFGFCTV